MLRRRVRVAVIGVLGSLVTAGLMGSAAVSAAPQLPPGLSAGHLLPGYPKPIDLAVSFESASDYVLLRDPVTDAYAPPSRTLYRADDGTAVRAIPDGEPRATVEANALLTPSAEHSYSYVVTDLATGTVLWNVTAPTGDTPLHTTSTWMLSGPDSNGPLNLQRAGQDSVIVDGIAGFNRRVVASDPPPWWLRPVTASG